MPRRDSKTMSRSQTTVIVNGIIFNMPIRSRPMPRPRVTRKGTYYGNGYDAWREKAVLLVRSAWLNQGKPPINEPYDVAILIDTRMGDLDNHIKSWLDIFQCAGILKDDRYVMKICAERIL